MKFLKSIFLLLLLLLIFTNDANAIIVIVPVILIPIVKIAALIVGALATPVISLSVWYLKMKNKPIYFGIIVGISILAILGILISLGIKITNPSRPLY